VPENSPFRNSAAGVSSPLNFRNRKFATPRFRLGSFRNVWAATLCLALGCLLLPAQVHNVDPGKTITFQVDGATAAYSLDGFFAEATAENGLVSVEGKVAGATHVVVIAPSGTQTIEILVNMLPPVYPPGFVAPSSAMELAQSGYYEGRFYSSPGEIQNQFDFSKVSGDNWTHFNVVETNLLGAGQGLPRAALSAATYEIATADRDITLFDKYLDLSPLTINGSIIRGFHMRLGNWFVHAGYTSVATFEGLFLPVQPELVVGGGYRYPLTGNSSITASFYQVQVRSSDRLGRSGGIGDVRYEYKPRESFWFNADLGISHGIASSGRLHYITSRDTILGSARYMPVQFASLGANNLRGLRADFSWTHHLTKKFETDLRFYNDNLVLPGIKEATISGAANLRYQLTRNWAVTGGALASKFQTETPPMGAIRNFTLPAGLAFQSRHFAGGGQYQFSVTPGKDSGARQFRASLHSGWGSFSVNAFAERDTNAPTLSFIFGQVTGLQQVLEQQGIQATSVQQVDQLLASDAYLLAAGFIKGASINVVPVREQLGGTVDWSTRGVHKRDLNYSFLYNDNQALQGSTEDVVHTLALTQHVTRADSLALSCSVLGLKNPGIPRLYSPVCFIAFRHQFEHVPYFIIPERRGAITGNVFRDDQSKGELEPGMPPMPEVEVMLDDVHRVLTGVDGFYRFPDVHRGKHKIEAMYISKVPFFFTTPSRLEVDEDATANFGIGYSLSGLAGLVLNDAGQGVAGVAVTIESRGKKWSATTEADGSFFVSSLVAGDYYVQADGDSLPAGYSTDGFGDAQSVTVGAAAPGKAAFTARAFRSISGRVLRYDTTEIRYVPVPGARMILLEPGLATLTDSLGRYLFRELAAGPYTVSVQNESQTPVRAVRLGAQPVDLTNVDFRISRPPSDSAEKPQLPPAGALNSGPADAALRIVRPDPPAPPAPVEAQDKPQPLPAGASGSRPANTARLALHIKPEPVVAAPSRFVSAAAEQHHLRGRQFSAAQRYREAVAELTEAIRLAPDFAMAFNARGFAMFKLHEPANAIEDLDHAILLDPGYANAYRIRAVAKDSIGDAAGAAVDFEKSRQLAH
jgi:hypothetical protein